MDVELQEPSEKKVKEEQGTRYNAGKPRISLVEPDFIRGTAEVLTFGAKKYGANNWKKGLPVSEIYDSLMRHLLAFRNGENIDDESKLMHLDHCAVNLMFIRHFQGTKWDDRILKNQSPSQ